MRNCIDDASNAHDVNACLGVMRMNWALLHYDLASTVWHFTYIHVRLTEVDNTPQIGRAAKSYRVYFSNTNALDDDEEDYLVDHSIVMYFMNKEGKFLEFFTQLAEVDEIVRRMAVHIRKGD